MKIKNEFFNRIQTKVKGIGENYECGDILIREDINTGICKAYSKNVKDVIKTDTISDVEIRKFIPNIEDKEDTISYRVLALPGGRCKVINDQTDQFNLYKFQFVFYALLGKQINSHERITKDFIEELIRQYQSHKGLMKYFKLEKLYFNKDACYIGKYIEGGEINYEELCGDVLSKFNYEHYEVEQKKTVATSEFLKDFGQQKTTLRFTIEAMQEIIKQDREMENRRIEDDRFSL